MYRPTIILFFFAICVSSLQLAERQVLAQTVSSRLDHGPLSSLNAQSGPSGEGILNDETAETLQNKIQINETPTRLHLLKVSLENFYAAIISFLHSSWHMGVFIAVLPFRVAKLYFSTCDFIVKSLHDILYELFWPPTEFFISLIQKVLSRFGDIILILGSNLASSALGPTIDIVCVSNPVASFIISSCRLLWRATLFCCNLTEFIHSLVNRFPRFGLYNISLNGILWLHKGEPYDHSLDAIIVLVVSISFLLPFSLGLFFSVPSIWYVWYVFSATSRLSEQELRQLENNVVIASEICHAFFVVLAIPRIFLALHLPSILLYVRDSLHWYGHKIHQSRSLPEFPAPFLYVQQWHFFLVKAKDPMKTIDELYVVAENLKQAIQLFWQTYGRSRESPLQRISDHIETSERENVTEDVLSRASQGRARSNVCTIRPVSYRDFPLVEQRETQSQEATTRFESRLLTRSRENRAHSSGVTFPRWADMEVSRLRETREENNNSSREEDFRTGGCSSSQLDSQSSASSSFLSHHSDSSRKNNRQRLWRRASARTRSSESIRAPECAICMENLAENSLAVTALRCAHTFHSCCIENWLERTPCCPICRNST